MRVIKSEGYTFVNNSLFVDGCFKGRWEDLDWFSLSEIAEIASDQLDTNEAGDLVRQLKRCITG